VIFPMELIVTEKATYMLIDILTPQKQRRIFPTAAVSQG